MLVFGSQKSVAEVEAPQVPVEVTEKKPRLLQEVGDFIKKHGITMAGAAISVALGILFIRSDTGQALVAQVRTARHSLPCMLMDHWNHACISLFDFEC